MNVGDRVRHVDLADRAAYGRGIVLWSEPHIEDGIMAYSIDDVKVRFDDGHEEVFWHTDLEVVEDK